MIVVQDVPPLLVRASLPRRVAKRHDLFRAGVLVLLLMVATLGSISLSTASQTPTLEATLVSLDHQNFPFIYLSVAVERDGVGLQTLRSGSFDVTENATPQTDYFEVTPPDTGGGVRTADIVFLMDNSGSMSAEQSAVAAHVEAFVDELEARGIDYRLGLCRFGAWEDNGNPIIEDAGVLTADAEYFRDDVWARNVVHGGFEPGWDALVEAASAFSFRGGVQKVFILITDETPTEDGNTGVYTKAEAIAALQGQFITTFALVDLVWHEHAVDDYGEIAEQTNGEYYNVLDPLDGILDYISSLIPNSYRIVYRSSDPSFNGIERHVQVAVSYQGDQAFCDGWYTPGSAPRIERTQDTLDLHDYSWAEGTPLSISAEITDTTAPFVQAATLYFRRTGDADFQATPMNRSAAIWTGTIPGGVVDPPGVDYYITATDGQSTASSPSVDPRTAPHQFAVLPNEAPQITHTPVTSAAENTRVTVSAGIVDTTNSLVSACLCCRRVGQLIYQCEDMSYTGGTGYEKTIPVDLLTAAGVEYYIQAMDDLGVGSYDGTPDNPHVVAVAGNEAPETTIDSASVNETNGSASFIWSGADDQTADGALQYCNRLLGATDSTWTSWSSRTSANYRDLPSGSYKFEVRSRDADGAIDPSPASHEFTIAEQLLGTLRGEVTDAVTGEGIPGATILLVPDPFDYSHVTDENGSFEFAVPPGTWQVTASAQGYTTQIQGEVAIAAGVASMVNFSLERATALECSVELWPASGPGSIGSIRRCAEFAIHVGGSEGDIGAVRFLGDSKLNGKPDGDWTEWFEWDSSSPLAGWDSSDRTKEWMFSISGGQEVWAEIRDVSSTRTVRDYAYITVSAPPYGPFPYGYRFRNAATRGLSEQAKRQLFDETFDWSHVADSAYKELLFVLYEGGMDEPNCYGMVASSVMEHRYPDYDTVLEGQDLPCRADYLWHVDAPLLLNAEDWDGYGIQENPILKHILRFQLAYHGTAESQYMEYTTNPRAMVDLLRESTDSSDYVICVGYSVRVDGDVETPAHALAPYEIIESEDAVRVYVYDPNSPDWDGDARQSDDDRAYDHYIEITEASNTWQYIFTWDQDGVPTYWPASKAIRSFLGLIPIAAHHYEHDGATYPGGRLTPYPGEYYCIVDGSADLLLSNSIGQLTGILGDEYYEEIADVRPVASSSGIGSRDANSRQAYHVSSDVAIGATVTGTSEGAYCLTNYGQDVFFAISGVETIAGVDDGFAFSDEGVQMCFGNTQQDRAYDLTFHKRHTEGGVRFVARDVAIVPGCIHLYTIDWTVLEHGEEGVTLEIDQDGDGVFERTIQAGSELSGEDIVDGDSDEHPSVSVSVRNGPNPVPNSGTAFFYALPTGTTTATLMLFNAQGLPVFATSLEPYSSRYPEAGTWLPVDQDGMPLANGPYVYVLIADGEVLGRGRMVIQR